MGRSIPYRILCLEQESSLDIGDKTLEEAFIGVKPEASHLRIFDCLVYTHVLKEKRTKLEPFGKKGTFVRYNKTLKAYMIYISEQRQG